MMCFNIDTKKHVSHGSRRKRLRFQASGCRAIIAWDSVIDHSGAIRVETEERLWQYAGGYESRFYSLLKWPNYALAGLIRKKQLAEDLSGVWPDFLALYWQPQKPHVTWAQNEDGGSKLLWTLLSLFKQGRCSLSAAIIKHLYLYSEHGGECKSMSYWPQAIRQHTLICKSFEVSTRLRSERNTQKIKIE